MCRPHREQARSHSRSAVNTRSVYGRDQKMWERACSRWRRVSRLQIRMCRPHREQARSHSGSPVNTKPVYGRDQPVGASLLAMRPDGEYKMLNAAPAHPPANAAPRAPAWRCWSRPSFP
ncbi:hypothetical protein C9422_29970 [Pseudomonas sp. B1(2018)]|nr:hypothetical protein C9422_29970 [Pseudomonas sp. B1(2018)]